MKAELSIIVEGYNESLEIGSMDDTWHALLAQTFPCERLEVILIGSSSQTLAWRQRYVSHPFHNLQVIAAEGHYYELKNQGAAAATAHILAFTDSDAMPDPLWAATIVDGIHRGADAVAGLTLYRSGGLETVHSAVHRAAASISWGFVVGEPRTAGEWTARGFLSHNLGIRTDQFNRIRYRTDLGRTCAGNFLHAALVEDGARLVLQTHQRVAHAFTFNWWRTRLHVRFGYEVMRLRRLDPHAKVRWVRRLGLLEPLLTAAWHVLLDGPQWWRYSKALELGSAQRVAILPLVMALSLVARGAEMAGMYRTLIAAERMRRFAESN